MKESVWTRFRLWEYATNVQVEVAEVCLKLHKYATNVSKVLGSSEAVKEKVVVVTPKNHPSAYSLFGRSHAHT